MVGHLLHVSAFCLGLDGPLDVGLVLVVFGHALVQLLLHAVKLFFLVFLQLLLEVFYLFLLDGAQLLFLGGELSDLLDPRLVGLF